MKKLFPIFFSFMLIACSNMTVTLTEYPEAERVGEVTVTLLPTSTSVPTLTPSPAPTETSAPALKWELHPLPDTPAELQASAITTEELVKLVGSDDQGEIMKWLKEQAEQKMDEVNKNWGDKPRATGLVTLKEDKQGYTFLGLSLNKNANGREQVPIQVLGVQMIEGDEPNVFFPAEWGNVEDNLSKKEHKPVLAQLGIPLTVKDNNGDFMFLTATGVTSNFAVFESKNVKANWDKWQTCLTNDGGEVPTIGFSFGNATGDGLGNGFMKALAFNFDKNGTLLSENSVGKGWKEAEQAFTVTTAPNIFNLKTQKDVENAQAILDKYGPFPMSCSTPGVFNEYKAK